MPIMMTQSGERSDGPKADLSILLASDSERHGMTMHRALQERGMAVEYRRRRIAEVDGGCTGGVMTWCCWR